MSKNILLPREYDTPAVQSAILRALKDYEQYGNFYVANPQIKWDLHKAWHRAEQILAHSHWKHRGYIAFGMDFSEYELTADSEDSVNDIYAVIAGIVAYEIMYPESGVSLRHILHKKAGAISIIISAKTAEILQDEVPSMLLAGRRRKAIVEEGMAPPPFPERNIALHG